MAKLYRFSSGGRGIYAAVEEDCPRNDPRRLDKPDGTWVPRVGPQHPAARSFWTEEGLALYLQSGLLAWHASVVAQPIEVELVSETSGAARVVYEDPHQVLIEGAKAQQVQGLEEFLLRESGPWSASLPPSLKRPPNDL